MSPEYKVVINQREGQSFKQLYIDRETPLANRVKITARHFGVEVKDIVGVLEDVRGVYLDSQESLFSEEDKAKNSGRGLDNYFEGRLSDLGVSQTHSTNLVVGVADHLALSNGEHESRGWWYTRIKLLEKLHEKIR